MHLVAQAFNYMKSKLQSVVSEEAAQDAFEYLLIIGGVTVAVILAIAVGSPNLINGVINGVCTAVNTVMATTC